MREQRQRDNDKRCREKAMADPVYRAKRNAQIRESKRRRKEREQPTPRTARSLLYSRFDPDLRRRIDPPPAKSVPPPNAIPSITKAQLMAGR